MNPLPSESDPAPSPCTKVCRMDGQVCAGCGRTLDEIVRWRGMSPDEKLDVLARLAAQKAASWAASSPFPAAGV
ncbi:MAG: DUF1289 domain-containing protein [Aquabacterium sp.]|uniref:DUF1289 domain-containing protein n=1 Tax=Aquabacterium sp. TaxID=1872578 RepID=UPI0027197013|nr:DUF1289 domain-containing protein [Aquabacterium sp.]MDO9001920.1 DUF1289 domain-containing protein [Aquabacterium sp.]